jgi:hypothetical protein
MVNKAALIKRNLEMLIGAFPGFYTPVGADAKIGTRIRS